jgi:TonB family protein
MSATANSLQKPQGFDLYLRKFRVICTMHGVEIGSRANLSGFMQKLMEDRHLAMDFWALVSKLSDREGGELSDDQILAVVVEGVTGSEPSDEDAETKRIGGDLRAMLAGVDIQSPGAGQVEVAPFPRDEAGQQQDDGELRIRFAEPSPQPSDARGASPPGTVAGEATRATALPTTPPPQLDEEFLRRELTRLVQLYFDSLDKKRTRLEPYVDEVTPVANVAGATTARSLEGLDGTDELTLRPTGKSRLVLEPTVSPVSPAEDSFAAAKNADMAKDVDIPIHVPLADYPQRSGYRRAVMYVVAALALFEGGFALYQHREQLQREASLLIQDIGTRTGLMSPPNLSAPTAAPIEPSASASEDSSTLQPGRGQQSAEQPAFQGKSTQPLPTADAVNIQAQPASAGGFDSGSNHKAMADRVAAQVEQISTNGITDADLAGAVRVSPSAMEANLVASRVPAYPETAKIEGVEGPVVMQAIISKDGFVKRMHVIQGDTRLRSAATEAVSRWRYRPYMLSGQPVEVATTITVDFNLDRR